MKKRSDDYIPYILSIISVIGASASIFSVYNTEFYTAFAILFSLSLILILAFLFFAKKHAKYKKYYRIRRELGQFSRKTRAYFQLYSGSDSLNEFEVGVKEATINILNYSSRVLSTLTGSKCTASIMLPCEDEKSFETVSYCDNVDIDRENVPSDPLDGEQGVIGRCIKTGRIQFWCNETNENGFDKIRDNYPEFYQSGISCPVFVNGSVAAILNIDAKKASSFQPHIKDIAVIFSNALASVYEVSDYEYSSETEL